VFRYVALLAILGCSPTGPVAEIDDQRAAAEDALSDAVDVFVGAGRTAVAYRDLAASARAAVARDPRIAADAERRLVSLALFPVAAVAASPLDVQADALALTVWPTLLAPSITDTTIQVRGDESAASYLDRLCREQAVLACSTIVPEFRPHVVAALAADRALARMVDAMAACTDCNDDGWRDIRRGWESVVRDTRSSLGEIQHRIHLPAWPTSGAASHEYHAPAVELEVAENELVFDGYRYANAARVAILRDVRARGELAFYVHPGAPVRRLTSLLRDAHAAGLHSITLIARTAAAPHARVAYTLSTTGDVGISPDAPVHALLYAFDQRQRVAIR
jgi:hypothetical protein